MSNRLAQESSPYLLQHADNPVDWYPWGTDALVEAKRQNKPILLSIGYAACHWCHVMAHESFEDVETAMFMNEHFINVKVDREERPDLDSIYMSAVVAMTGQGGWPMTVALTPEGEPFYGGTYFPPTPRFGMPSFRQVLEALVNAWKTKRDELVDSAASIANHISQVNIPGAEGLRADKSLLDQAVVKIEQAFEPRKGGFGTAPKFPQPMTLDFLLRRYIIQPEKRILRMCEHSLQMMARGGIYDHIGGGFARYSTDDDWLVPHFEKMLYDNGLLARLYLQAWQVTGNDFYRRTAEETLDWALIEMRHKSGGFFSSLDADSEGVEGRFYVWTEKEIRRELGDDAEIFCQYYGVTSGGNWESRNILSISSSYDALAEFSGLSQHEIIELLDKSREKLYAYRSKRVWPGLDDKVLTSWNGLMMTALSEAARVLGKDEYREAAVSCAEFLHKTMRQKNGRLLRSWREGSEAKYNAYLEDYSYLAYALLSLYQTTFDTKWFDWAVELAEFMLTHFRDEENGDFFDTSDDHEKLIHRPKDLQDNATPSGNSVAAHVFLQLSLFTGRQDYWEIAEKMIGRLGELMVRAPTGFAYWLCATDFLLADSKEIAIAGPIEWEDTKNLLEAAFKRYRPNLVVAAGMDVDTVPLMKNRKPIRDQATAYVCRRFVCNEPVYTPDELEALMDN